MRRRYTLDPETDLAGATPETLARALLRRGPLQGPLVGRSDPDRARREAADERGEDAQPDAS